MIIIIIRQDEITLTTLFSQDTLTLIINIEGLITTTITKTVRNENWTMAAAQGEMIMNLTAREE